MLATPSPTLGEPAMTLWQLPPDLAACLLPLACALDARQHARPALRLRPRLGDAGLGGAAPAVGRHRPAPAGLPVRPQEGRGRPAARVPLAVPHQAGAGRRAGGLAGPRGGLAGQAAVAG